MIDFTADELIDRIQRDSFLPVSQGQWTHAKILSVLDDMQVQRVLPRIIAKRQGYLREIAPDITLVAGQAAYDMPAYAMFWAAEEVMLVDASTGYYWKLDIMQPPDLLYFHALTQSTPRRFWMTQSQIYMDPPPDINSATKYNLRTWIYRRPGRLVRASADTADPTTNPAGAAQVLSVNPGTGVVTYTAAPPSSYTSSSVHDFYRGVHPFRRIDTAVTASAQGGSTQTFPLADAALLQPGDWVCPKDKTVFPAIPSELYGHLVRLATRSMSRTQGDQQAYENDVREILDDMVNATATLDDRIQAHPTRMNLLHSPFVRNVGRRGMRSINDPPT